MGMRNRILILVALAALVAMGGCSQQKTISREELKSTLQQVSSIAGEAELFVSVLKRRDTTQEFAGGHIEFLEQKLEESQKKLEAKPERGTGDAFNTAKDQAKELHDALEKMKSAPFDAPTLDTAADDIQELRQKLDEARGSL
jgi:hypothetical protein